MRSKGEGLSGAECNGRTAAIYHVFYSNSYIGADFISLNEGTMIALKLGKEGRGLSGFPNKQKE